MVRLSPTLLLLGLGCGGGGGKLCDLYCDQVVRCSVGLYMNDCDADDAVSECENACLEEWREKSTDREEVETCIICLTDELEDECDESTLAESLSDCEDDCDDSDVLDFFEDVDGDWMDELSCGSDSGATSNDRPGGTTTADAVILAAQASCPDDATFQIMIETNFSVGDAILNIWEVNAGATGWDEEHALVGAPTAGAAGDDVTWALTDDGMWMSGTETLFSCGTHDVSGAMVYVARAFDADGVYEDCAAWGGDASNIDEVLATPEGGGDVTSYNGVTDMNHLGFTLQLWQ